MGAQRRLDEVSVFGGKLSFLIPHEWIEDQSEEDTYLYHAPETNSGWLRVSLITIATPTPDDRLRALFVDSAKCYKSRKRGNLVEPSVKSSHENGTDIYIYYWKVANVLQPNRVLEAVFSYTILAARRDDSETQEEVELIGSLVSEATFSGGPQ